MTPALTVAVWLVCCGKAHDGPKLLEADGVKYIACGGVLWLSDQGNDKDPNTKSYDVFYKDAKGATHELKRVRSLNVTDLASDSKECAAGE